MAVFEGKKSSNDIINDTMSDDEVVTSDEPQRYLLFSFRVFRLSSAYSSDYILSDQ